MCDILINSTTMKIKQIILFILIAYTKLSFTQNVNLINNKTIPITEIANNYDSTNFVIFKYDTTYRWICKDCLSTELNIDELLKTHLLTEEYVKNYNSDTFDEYEGIGGKLELYQKKKHSSINLKKYKKQYIVTLNSKGEKEVWINCFCNDWNKNWRKELIIIKDGGACYFNLKINISIGYLHYFEVNGDS